MKMIGMNNGLRLRVPSEFSEIDKPATLYVRKEGVPSNHYYFNLIGRTQKLYVYRVSEPLENLDPDQRSPLDKYVPEYIIVNLSKDIVIFMIHPDTIGINDVLGLADFFKMIRHNKALEDLEDEQFLSEIDK